MIPSSGFATPGDIPLEYNASLFGNDLDSKSNSTRLFTQINYRMGADWRSPPHWFRLPTSGLSGITSRVLPEYSPVEAARDVWIYGPITKLFQYPGGISDS